MHIGNPMIVTLIFGYSINGEIEEVDNIKTLESYLINHWNFIHMHVAKAIAKANAISVRFNKEIICIFEQASLNFIV